METYSCGQAKTKLPVSRRNEGEKRGMGVGCFFPAEGGIRGVERFRGVGDVY